MKEIIKLTAQVDAFRAERARLAAAIANEDEQYGSRSTRLQESYYSQLKRINNDFDTAQQRSASAVSTQIAEYSRMLQHLHGFVGPIQRWCPREQTSAYVPNPGQINEEQVHRLIRMVQEGGIIAWIKRTFHLGGYSSREEMAMSAYRQIEDACAFCENRKAELEREAAAQSQSQATNRRRACQQAEDRFNQEKQRLLDNHLSERASAEKKLRAYETGEQMRSIHAASLKMRARSEEACGSWGSYSVPETMPDQVEICSAQVSLPSSDGKDKVTDLPVWMDLFDSNIVVITLDPAAGMDQNSEEKKIIRRFLARMLKTIPPEYCSYTVFDMLHKGNSLGRLLDILNIGTTDINLELFTRADAGSDGTSGAERRRYLCNRPADINKYIAGRSASLFAFNRENGEFQFPFTWIIDFDFPDEPDQLLQRDMKELFVNARAAGYSFIFVTGKKGTQKIDAMARQYANCSVTHLDMERKTISKDGVRLTMGSDSKPSPEQIYNYITALKDFYETSGVVDNRINTVFAEKGVETRDASKYLSIPIALDSRRRLVDITFGGDGSVHGFVSGASNSGKSTLLHTVILSACLHYTPEELEIWLVDYKQLEFHLYKKNTPPHVKLLGISKTADFTYSLLDRLEEEAARRTELMHRYNAQNLQDYRKHKDEPDYVNIPRLFVVIDEFHEMSQFVATDMEYKDKLENVLREYRAQGITFLLADQTFGTGLSGLSPSAKAQIGVRIAMRNESSIQEVKDTLEVDRALYSDSMNKTISLMSQGDFIMKMYVRNAGGELTDVRLEKFKALFTKGSDISPLGKALRRRYRGSFNPYDMTYVDTTKQTPWSDADIASIDRKKPIRYPNIRLYLGHPATLDPCFCVDLGRQPNENMSILGGTAFQRWELLHSVMRSCVEKNYQLIVFMAEYSDLMSDHGDEIRSFCEAHPNIRLMETIGQWCTELKRLESIMDSKMPVGDTVCMFIGLEVAVQEFNRMPDQNGGSDSFSSFAGGSFLSSLMAQQAENVIPKEEPEEFNATPIIRKLFSSGARYSIRCICEVSVYRQMRELVKLEDMCKHRIAFQMGADDCMMYLGNSNFHKNIGAFAVYTDGAKSVKKLIPYQIETGGCV